MADTATPTQDQVKQVQQKTVEIGNRLKSDAAFQAQYKADPAATLKSQGLPEQAVNELLTKVSKETGKGDVSGYDYYQDVYYTDGTGIRNWYDDYGNFEGYQVFTW